MFQINSALVFFLESVVLSILYTLSTKMSAKHSFLDMLPAKHAVCISPVQSSGVSLFVSRPRKADLLLTFKATHLTQTSSSRVYHDRSHSDFLAPFTLAPTKQGEGGRRRRAR